MKTLSLPGLGLPSWLSIALMLVGCLGLMACACAWLFGEGPMSTPWFMASFSACTVLVAVVTTDTWWGFVTWAVLLISLNTVLFTQYMVTNK